MNSVRLEALKTLTVLIDMMAGVGSARCDEW